jgi:hypothetical protein
MSETTLHPVNIYRETSGLIRQSVAGLTEEQLEWKPAPEKWSVKEVVAHLVDSSLVHGVRIRKIVAEQAQPFILYDQDAWVSSSYSNQASLHDIISAFEALLAYNSLFYERLTQEDWNRKGLNNGKEVSVAELFEGFIRHVHTHLVQIERTKAAYLAERL